MCREKQEQEKRRSRYDNQLLPTNIAHDVYDIRLLHRETIYWYFLCYEDLIVRDTCAQQEIRKKNDDKTTRPGEQNT